MFFSPTFFASRFPEDSGVFAALLKSKTNNNQMVSSCSVIVQGEFSRISARFIWHWLLLAKDDEPLDPIFTEFPQSVTVDEGGKAKFTSKLSGSTPMTGKQTRSIVCSIDFFSFLVATWQFNGKPLETDSTRLTISANEKDFSLEIPLVVATDQGQYQVTIANDKGEITAAFSLHVDHWKTLD